MTTNLVAPTESQLSIIPDTDFATWRQTGERLVRTFRANENTLELDQWTIGDWILQGVENETFDKKKAYNEAKRITGYDQAYLQTVVWVVGRFREPSLRKESTLKWSHFKELAYIADEKLRATALKELGNHVEPSVREIREFVQRLVNQKDSNSGEKPVVTSKQWVSMQVSLKPELRHTIKALAKIERTDPDKLLGRWATAYYEEHEKEISAKIAKFKQKRRKKR